MQSACRKRPRPQADITGFRSVSSWSNLSRSAGFSLLAAIFMGCHMAHDFTKEETNKSLVQASFDRWKSGSGGPFELLAPDVEWTIVGSSPLAKTYKSKKEFIDEVIDPFNARMSKPLVPTVRGIYADGDMVIILFDAEATVRDGKPYRNTYTWYFQIRDAKVIKAIAFFDNRDFDEFWDRVSPKP
jgi:ketosteroid isomerase-like protein